MNIKWDTPTQFVYTNIDTHLQTDTAISKVMESRDIETRHHSNDITFSFFVFHFQYVFLFLVLILIFIVYFFFALCRSPTHALGSMSFFPTNDLHSCMFNFVFRLLTIGTRQPGICWHINSLSLPFLSPFPIKQQQPKEEENSETNQIGASRNE